MNIEDTHRTDKDSFLVEVGDFNMEEVVEASLSRDLERELNKANARIKELESTLAWKPIGTAPLGKSILVKLETDDGFSDYAVLWQDDKGFTDGCQYTFEDCEMRDPVAWREIGEIVE